MLSRFLPLLFLVISFCSYSQDLIVKTNGDSVRCKILQEEPGYFKVEIRDSGDSRPIRIYKEEIKLYSYRVDRGAKLDLLVLNTNDTIQCNIIRIDHTKYSVEVIRPYENEVVDYPKSEIKGYQLGVDKVMRPQKSGVDTIFITEKNFIVGTIVKGDKKGKVSIKVKSKSGKKSVLDVDKNHVQEIKYGEILIGDMLDGGPRPGQVEDHEANEGLSVISIGVGAGLDCGGYGANLLLYGNKHIGIIGGVGYSYSKTPGSNMGLKIRLDGRQESRPELYFMALYGSNVVLQYEYSEDDGRLFYGGSIGMGMDIRTNKMKGGGFSFAILYPLTGSYQEYKRDHPYDEFEDPPGIRLSISYRFALKSIND